MRATNALVDEVKRAAARSARSWDGVAEADDIAQDMWLHLLEKGRVDAVAEMDDEVRPKVLGRIADQVAKQERADYEAFRGNFVYSTDEVRAILEDAASVLDPESRSGSWFVASGGTENVADAADTPGSETHAEHMDLAAGLARLRDSNPRYADILTRHYVHGEEIGYRIELTRARDALTREMNTVRREAIADHDGPRKGGRKP
ncbi:hypothetical protein [Amycolatopsis orientalis]|uniref:hypothetical protein n=1 Tax=Amycolatopsis orientalis TaxID=31958 RepID=UPI00039ADE3D|nr:hypothetical protein [Amycolatopsis orientalis]